MLSFGWPNSHWRNAADVKLLLSIASAWMRAIRMRAQYRPQIIALPLGRYWTRSLHLQFSCCRKDFTAHATELKVLQAVKPTVGHILLLPLLCK